MSSNGRKTKNTNCQYCGVPFTANQIKYNVSIRFCSKQCGNHAHSELPEPITHEQKMEFYKQVSKGKQEVRTEVQEVVDRYSPVDDSPEAERTLRQEVCPNPEYNYHSTLTKYDVKTKDIGYGRRRKYSE